MASKNVDGSIGQNLLREIFQRIDKLTTLPELRQVNVAVKSRWAVIEQRRASIFVPGERVSFLDADGQRILGEVERVNRTSITVKTPHGHWRVSPTILTVLASEQESACP